jgi:hypothetical protein
MGDVKPWQIVVLVSAVVMLAASVYFSMGDGDVRVDSHIRMMDAATGELFSIRVGKGGATIPGKNPKTGEKTLMPVEEREPGQWFIRERYLGALTEIQGDKSAVVDPKTGRVRVSGK